MMLKILILFCLFNVTLLDKIAFVGQNYTLYSSNITNFYCIFNGERAINVGAKIFPPFNALYNNFSVTLLNVSKLDEGYYSCNDLTETSFFLKVLDPVPNINIKLHHLESDNEYCTYTLKCNGSQTAKIIWWESDLKENTAIFHSDYYSSHLFFHSHNISIKCKAKFNDYVNESSSSFYPHNVCFKQILKQKVESENLNIPLIIILAISSLILILMTIWAIVQFFKYIIKEKQLYKSSFKENLILFFIIFSGVINETYGSNITDYKNNENSAFYAMLISLTVLFALSAFFVVLKLSVLIAIRLAEYLDRKNNAVKIHLNDLNDY